jgi:hypothetical protein
MQYTHVRFVESAEAPTPESPLKGPYFWLDTTSGKLYFRPNHTSVWREVLLGETEEE